MLFNAVKDLSKEQPKTNLEELNVQKGWFAPKGSLDSDRVAVVRTANNFRTIFGTGKLFKQVVAGGVQSFLNKLLR